MSPWMVKTAVQHVIGRLPKSYWWNGLFQKYITKGYYPGIWRFKAQLSYCRQHYDDYCKYCPAPKSKFKALELGTGPWPIVPIALYLAGATKIWTYDIVPLLQRDTLKRTLELFCDSSRNGVLEKKLGKVTQNRLRHIEKLLEMIDVETPAQLLRKINIHLCIGDARNTNLPENFVDLIFSTVVFEHIDAEILAGLLVEFKRVASPDAVMSHYIGLADQYASFDKSITPYNFLKYSDRQWKLLNNPLIPLSRLRIADYRKVFSENGWDIVEERSTSGSCDDLLKIELSPKFRKYTTEDLLVLFSWIVARPFKNPIV